MALTRVQGLLPALGWAEHYRHRLFQDSVADWVRAGGGVPQACSGTPENLNPRSRLVPKPSSAGQCTWASPVLQGALLLQDGPCVPVE